MRPLFIYNSNFRLQILCIAGLCDVAIRMLCVNATYSRILFNTCASVASSNPLVASSRIRILGFRISTRANASLCF